MSEEKNEENMEIIDLRAIDLIELMLSYIGELHSQNIALGESANTMAVATLAENKKLVKEIEALKKKMKK